MSGDVAASTPSNIEEREYLVLSVLLTKVDEMIGAFWSFREVSAGYLPLPETRAALDVLEQHQLASISTIRMPGQRRPDPMIQLTTRGLAFCLLHEADLLKAAFVDVGLLATVREAFDRIRASEEQSTFDSSLWTGIAKRMDAGTVAKIQSGVTSLIEVINQSDLTAVERQNALAYARAVDDLVKAPDPPWKTIVELLTSKPLTAFLNVTALLALILGMMT